MKNFWWRAVGRNISEFQVLSCLCSGYRVLRLFHKIYKFGLYGSGGFSFTGSVNGRHSPSTARH